MKTKTLNALVLSVIASTSLTFFAQADEGQTAPEGANSEASSSVQPASVTESFSRIQAPRFSLENYGGGIGGSEQGFALNGRARFTSPDGSWIALKGTVGAPLLQINGSTEMIPVRLVRTPIEVGSGHDLQFRLDVVPVSADAQIQAAISGAGSNHHLIIDPKIAAELDWLSPESLALGARVRLNAGPAGGVIHDGDGTSGLFGIQIGTDFGLNYAPSMNDELDFLCGVNVITAVHDGVDPASVRSRCEIGWTRTLGQQGNLRVALGSERSVFDVVDNSNSDSGVTQFTGVSVTFTPSRVRSHSGE